MGVAAATPARDGVLKVWLRNDVSCGIGLGTLGLPESTRCSKQISAFGVGGFEVPKVMNKFTSKVDWLNHSLGCASRRCLWVAASARRLPDHIVVVEQCEVAC